MTSWTSGLVLSLLLAGCSITRPDQDNFEIDASKGNIETFVAALSKTLQTSPERTIVSVHEADPGEMFTFKSRDAVVVVQSQPDERCNPNAPMHITYKQRRYDVDLVYRTSSEAKRLQAKQRLIGAAKVAEIPIQMSQGC